MGKFVSDKALVRACIKGNSSAQWELYDTYIQAMYNTVYRYTCNHQDTQDILQNGFTRVFKHLKKFDHEKGTLLSWMRKIHIRCALDFINRKHYFTEEIEVQTHLIDTQPTAWEELEAEYILKLIEGLNPRDRIIFNLRHIEGYSHEEIAQMLSINVNSSRVYLARARKILREQIKAHELRLSIVP